MAEGIYEELKGFFIINIRSFPTVNIANFEDAYYRHTSMKIGKLLDNKSVYTRESPVMTKFEMFSFLSKFT